MNELPPEYQLMIIQSRLESERLASKRNFLARSSPASTPRPAGLIERVSTVVRTALGIPRCRNADCEGLAH
jgi:hypothetical protein